MYLLIPEHEMYWHLNLFWSLIYLPTLCTFQCTILIYFLFNWFLHISFFLVLLLVELFLNFILDCSLLGYRYGIDFYIDLISCVLVYSLGFLYIGLCLWWIKSFPSALVIWIVFSSWFICSFQIILAKMYFCRLLFCCHNNGLCEF